MHTVHTYIESVPPNDINISLNRTGKVILQEKNIQTAHLPERQDQVQLLCGYNLTLFEYSSSSVFVIRCISNNNNNYYFDRLFFCGQEISIFGFYGGYAENEVAALGEVGDSSE